MAKWIRWLEELCQADYALVGKKCANWGEMAGLGLPVPPGFALTVEAYEYFFARTGLRRKICAILDDYAPRLEEYRVYLEASQAIRRVVEGEELPEEIAAELRHAYAVLSLRCGTAAVPVSVRSSGPVSRPGQFETYLNVKGEAMLCRKVVHCWSSTFTAQALAYRRQRNLPLAEEPIAVGVMRLVEARAAGVAFTADPATGATDRIVIEGSWGLGESVVGGRVSPDRFVLAKQDLSLISSRHGEKGTKVVATTGGVEEIAVETAERARPCLGLEELTYLGRLVLKLEEHFGVPQDVEWAVSATSAFPQNIFLLQTRPIAGLSLGAAANWEPRATSRTPTDHIIDLMLRRVFQSS